MTVLVTGGAGFIGAHVVKKLLAKKEKVVVVDDLSSGWAGRMPINIPFEIGDIADTAFLRSVFRRYSISAVVHLAGSILVGDSIKYPLLYHRNNVVASHTLLTVMLEFGVRTIVFSSSAAVYGDPSQTPVTEEADLRPVNPYGWNKLTTEMMLRDYAKAYGLRYVALRYFNAAGPGYRRRPASHLIPRAVHAVLGIEPYFRLNGADYPTRDGTCDRDYVHVEDLADAHYVAWWYLLNGGTSLALNCGGGKPYSNLEVLQKIRSISGVDFPIEIGPRRQGDPASLVAHIGLIRETLGWVPKLGLETMIGNELEFARMYLSKPTA